MNRRKLAAVAAALMLAAGLGGCGIPDETGVKVDGAGPARGDGSDGGPPREPPKRTDTGEDDPEGLAANFLRAAAGEASGAHERVQAYIAPDAREPEPQGGDVAIHLVRITSETLGRTPNLDGSSWVTIPVEHVGVLRADGSVGPPEARGSQIRILVGPVRVNNSDTSVENKGLYVKEPPPMLLMSTDALQEFYRQRTIYFWNKDRTALVPDLRHLPLAVPPSLQATEVVDWLTGGPADWLKGSVAALPPNTKTLGNVTQSGGRLVINLSIEFAPGDQQAALRRLETQLAWSLANVAPHNELEIKIKDRPHRVLDAKAHRETYPVYRIADIPQRFCVYAGKIHRLVVSGDPPYGPPPIAAKVNRNIVSAAISGSDAPVMAALVVAAPQGRRLAVGSGADTVEALKVNTKIYPDMSRPVWLRGAEARSPVGLVVADGRLHRFGADASLTAVDLSTPGKVTAVAAALDGHRIAFIAGGELYVAALTIDGSSVVVGQARRLHSALGHLTEVAWRGENLIVLAGVTPENQVALHDLTVDGARETALVSSTAKVTHLAAYPENPVRPSGGGRVMYVQNGVAWDTFTDKRIGRDQVDGLPSPSTGEQATPTAPFFLY